MALIITGIVIQSLSLAVQDRRREAAAAAERQDPADD